MKPHKHADLIHAYADGAEIQTFYGGKWEYEPNPAFYADKEYRIKPRTVKQVGWVNIHKPPTKNSLQYAIIHPSVDAAIENASTNCIATVKVEWTEEVE